MAVTSRGERPTLASEGDPPPPHPVAPTKAAATRTPASTRLMAQNLPRPNGGMQVPMATTELATTVLKACGACETVKPIDQFSRNRTRKDGRQNSCKACMAVRTKAWYRANKPRAAELQTRWREENRERTRELQRNERAEDPAGRRERERRVREKHPEKVNARQALRYAVRTGKVQKADSCERCGQPSDRSLHGHHRDYSKPLEVEWLCWECHAEVHKP